MEDRLPTIKAADKTGSHSLLSLKRSMRQWRNSNLGQNAGNLSSKSGRVIKRHTGPTISAPHTSAIVCIPKGMQTMRPVIFFCLVSATTAIYAIQAEVALFYNPWRIKVF
jgi:hypothetical protein